MTTSIDVPHAASDDAGPAIDPDLLRAWRNEGLVLLRGVLDDEQLSRMRAAAQQLTHDGWDRDGSDRRFPDDYPHSVRSTAVVAATDAFDELIDHPRALPVLITLLGPELQMAGSEVFARRNSERPMSRFHTDFGPSLQRILLKPESAAIQLKIQYFLTDVHAPDEGNFVYLPGSHLLASEMVKANCHVGSANEWLDRGEWPPDAVQVVADAGDAVVFWPGLWHAVASNVSGPERLTAILRYSQLWCRPHDESATAADRHAMTPRRAALLGRLPAGSQEMDYYKPRHLFDA